MQVKVQSNRHLLSMFRVWGLILTAACVSACKEEKKTVAEPPPLVMVIPAHYASLGVQRTLAGTVQPRIESNLSFRIGGKVARRLVDVGARVEIGQLLAVLDDVDPKLQLEQAQAEVAAAKANLDTANNAQTRMDTLGKSGWATTADQEKLRAAAGEAQGRYLRAERAQSLAQNALRYSELRADRAGVITAAEAETGQVVAAGQPVFRLAGLDEKEVQVFVPEVLLDTLSNDSASLTLWPNRDKIYQAKLRELSPVADVATRTYAARFSVAGAGEEIQLGRTANLTLHGNGESLVRLPLSALLDQGQGKSVYVFDPAQQSVNLKNIDVERFDGDGLWVRSGLSEGDQVVAFGVQKLAPGERVRAAPLQNY